MERKHQGGFSVDETTTASAPRSAEQGELRLVEDRANTWLVMGENGLRYAAIIAVTEERGVTYYLRGLRPELRRGNLPPVGSGPYSSRDMAFNTFRRWFGRSVGAIRTGRSAAGSAGSEGRS
jgi:hypothetical protein